MIKNDLKKVVCGCLLELGGTAGYFDIIEMAKKLYPYVFDHMREATFERRIREMAKGAELLIGRKGVFTLTLLGWSWINKRVSYSLQNRTN